MKFPQFLPQLRQNSQLLTFYNRTRFFPQSRTHSSPSPIIFFFSGKFGLFQSGGLAINETLYTSNLGRHEKDRTAQSKLSVNC